MPSFAILCIGRVGSEHLVSLLASHPDITCFSELFAPKWAVEPQQGTLGVSHFVRTGHERPATYWQELMEAAETPMAGLKLPWSSIEAHPETLELIRSPETRIVRLTREDRLAQYVSAWLALESGVWRSTQGAYRPRTIRVDPAKCLHALNVIDGQEKHLDQLGL